MNIVTNKKIQLHEECSCGMNIVSDEVQRVRYKDFKKIGIKRKIDKQTGKPFLFRHVLYKSCHNCNDSQF